MSLLVYYLFLHLFVSMHACNSRHLGFFDKEPKREHHPIKIPETKMADFRERNSNENNTKQEVILHEQNSEKGINIKTQVSQEENKIEGRKTHARSTMASKQQDSKEAINSKDNNVPEDVVVMDYAQPHRKPPIHNMKP